MKPARQLPTLPVILLAALCPAAAWSAAPAEHDHTHGAKPAAAPAASVSTTTATTPAAAPGQADDLMQRMSRLHERMMAAKTPAERQKLMAEGRQLMQEGMAALRDMKPGAGMGMMGGAAAQGSADNAQGGNAAAAGGGMNMDNCMGMHKEMMGKRMDMMEMMMQTMMDQQAGGATMPAGK